ncbi:MAG: replication initiation factor domain-containing protein, partial [Oscillospiraceae bacterium]|nr:replication initiation factor domain-containing protein [Oscillospiraceae bacterium]
NGSTIYIGAPSSDFRVRIYDKALEQGAEGHWVRRDTAPSPSPR